MKKQLISIGIICIVISGVMGCKDRMKKTEYTQVNELSGIVMSIKEGTLKDYGAVVEIYNEGDFAVMFGQDYELEQKIKGKWYQVPYIVESIAWDDIGYDVRPDDLVELEVRWEWNYGKLEAGEYRIVKEASVGNDGDAEKSYFDVEFVIE